MVSASAHMLLGEVGENSLANILEKRKSAPENTLSGMIEP
jgi:hypothetical protein